MAGIPASIATGTTGTIDLDRSFAETGGYSTDRSFPASPFWNADPLITDANGDGIDDPFSRTLIDSETGRQNVTFIDGRAFHPAQDSFFAADDVDTAHKRTVTISSAHPNYEADVTMNTDIDGCGGSDLVFGTLFPNGPDADHGFGVLMGESLFPSDGGALVFEDLPPEERALLRITGLGSVSQNDSVLLGHLPLLDIAGVVD
jgi:hypothetical protein